MARPLRTTTSDIIYHRLTNFEDAGDYEAFAAMLEEAVGRFDTHLLGYAAMPNEGF